MTNLSTTEHAAWPSAGAAFALVVGAGQAASVTINAGAACTAFSWDQATSTLTCLCRTHCVVTGPRPRPGTK